MHSDPTLRERPLAAAPASVPILHVLYSAGSVGAVSRPLAGERFAIGRAQGSDLTLLDPRVSREHAKIELSDGEVILRDTSSTETQVNGERISSRVLCDGDLIRVGDSFVLFRADAGLADAPALGGLLGVSPAVRALRKALSLVGPTPATVLLLGETGSGKEVAARALHELGRRKGPFVAVNCGAIAESLAESQLFGHAAGSFTGAKKSSPGFFRAADGGTLFLDEVGELPIELQPKLLRALEERKVVPVGETDAVAFDARIVAATNRPLIEAVGAGGFRADLYARLGEFTIELPSLRARREDVLPILLHALGEPTPELDAELVSALLLHPWPFNVRELYKVALQLRVRGQGSARLTFDLFEPHLRHSLPPPIVPPVSPSAPAPAVAAAPEAPAPQGGAAGEAAPIPSRAELDALLRRWRGVIADVARETGRSRKQVYRWLEEHGLDLSSYRDG
jgi:DNA-binding NtrC family response regulator